jgi:biotin synthase
VATHLNSIPKITETVDELSRMIASEGKERQQLLKKAGEVQEKVVGNKVFYRGLIEFSNLCTKDCFYCGIRKSNKNVARYDIDDEAILKAAKFAHENRYGSLVLQSGERSDDKFVERISRLLHEIKKISNGELGITISLGEQTRETYQEWYKAGAHRYLLRIESSNEELYYKIHPSDDKHDFQTRLKCLYDLKELGYQTGTGVMIGLPFQTYDHLAKDLLFMKELDIDMCGMGPFIEHHDTPLYKYRDQLWPLQRRFEVALNMIASLRLLMPDINIAAATALQAIDPMGREKALQCGANVIMPNITPTINRKNYLLYENKPCTDEGAEECTHCLEARIGMAGREVGFGEWGDSKHYRPPHVTHKN